MKFGRNKITNDDGNLDPFQKRSFRNLRLTQLNHSRVFQHLSTRFHENCSVQTSEAEGPKMYQFLYR